MSKTAPPDDTLRDLLNRTFDALLLEQPAPYILTVTLNRPASRNAFTTRMAEELVSVMRGLTAVSAAALRCVILTGAGDKAFCAGADLKERKGMSDTDWRAQHTLFEEMSEAVMNCPVPVIAAVRGAAFAGGFELALGCSFIYAATESRFALTEVTLGLIPGIGGTQLLPRRVGVARANEILLTGAPFSADDALSWGIVNRLLPSDEVLPAAIATAQRIAGNAPLATRQALKSARDGNGLPMPQALQVELDCYRTLIGSNDLREGILAFNEKRKPEFNGS